MPTPAGPEFLVRGDLDAMVTSRRVDQLFDDDGDGVADPANLSIFLARAEQKAFSILLRAYNHDEVIVLMQQDQFTRSCVAGIACEYASRRKPEWVDSDGKGRFFQEFKESIEHLEKLSKGREKTTATPTTNSQAGGRVRPAKLSPQTPTFTFAPTDNIRTPRGGF